MNATIVIYGSSTGTCEAIAEKIASKLGCEALNVQDLTADIVANCRTTGTTVLRHSKVPTSVVRPSPSSAVATAQPIAIPS